MEGGIACPLPVARMLHFPDISRGGGGRFVAENGAAPYISHASALPERRNIPSGERRRASALTTRNRKIPAAISCLPYYPRCPYIVISATATNARAGTTATHWPRTAAPLSYLYTTAKPRPRATSSSSCCDIALDYALRHAPRIPLLSRTRDMRVLLKAQCA